MRLLFLALVALLGLGAVGAPAKAPQFMGAAARPGSAVPQADPRFGIHVTGSESPPPYTFGVQRLWDSGAIWCRMNPAPGVWDFTPLLSQLDGAAARGAHTAIVVLGFPPEHAVPGSRPNSGEASWLCPTRGFASVLPADPVWDDYVARTADQVAAWRATHPQVAVAFQVWNEPALTWFLQGSPQRLVELAGRARAIVTQHAPGAQLISPPIVANTEPRRARWQQRFVAASAGQQLFHVWAVHVYPVGETLLPLWADYTARLNDVLATVAPARMPGDQVWITEINANVAIASPPLQVLSPEDQATFVQMVAHDTTARGIPVVVWYRWLYDPWQLGNGQIVFGPDAPTVAAWQA